MYEKELPIGDRVTFENAHQIRNMTGSDEEETESAEDQREEMR